LMDTTIRIELCRKELATVMPMNEYRRLLGRNVI
jgi:hypothetical protein